MKPKIAPLAAVALAGLLGACADKARHHGIDDPNSPDDVIDPVPMPSGGPTPVPDPKLACNPYIRDPNDARAPTGGFFIPPSAQVVCNGNQKVFPLTAAKSSTVLNPANPNQLASTTAGINGANLAPTIIVNNGDPVKMQVTNNLGEPLALHWHGLHVAPRGDGSIEDTLAPGQVWQPEMTIKQEAAPLWYHPHTMGSTSKQIAYGMVGMFIVYDASAASTALPHTYGVDDFTVIMQQASVEPNGNINSSDNGLASTSAAQIMLVNGVNTDVTAPTLNTPMSRIRLRLLNASLGSEFTIRFSDNSSFVEVATDGGFLPTPLTVTQLKLGPAERAEILVEPNAAQKTLQLTSFGWTRSAPAVNRSFPVLQVTRTADAQALPPVPATLNTITPLQPTFNQTIVLDGTQPNDFGIGVPDVATNKAPHNTSEGDMISHAIRAKLDRVEQWTLRNNSPGGGNSTNVPHWFHVHDVQFQVVDVNGAAPSGDKVGWKDTIRVDGQTSVNVRMQFTDFADAANGYMLHCHITSHEDDGMMTYLFVDP